MWKSFKKWSSQQKMELTNNSEYQHRSIWSLKKSLSLPKKSKFQIFIQGYQNSTWKIKIYGICKHRANNIGINRTGDGSRDGVDPLSFKVSHIWDWSLRWNRPSKGTTQIWIQIWSWTTAHHKKLTLHCYSYSDKTLDSSTSKNV